jgi:hypothetical protein
MTHSLLVLSAFAVAALAGAAGLVSAQAPASPGNQPGLPTLAQVHILNRDRAEAVPVKVQNTGDSLPVIVVGETAVTWNPTAIVGARAARQTWEYRRLVVPAADDATPALNAAGLEGWEAVGAASVSSNVVWTLKRPR